MALPWILAILSLLPLMGAKNPECDNLIGTPISNTTLDQLAGKWFYFGSVFRLLEFAEWAKKVHSAFIYFTPNKTEDTVYFREYQTFEDRCLYDSGYMFVQRENGTLSRNVTGVNYFANLLPTKDPGIQMLAYYPENQEEVGLSFYANTTKVTPEQMSEFHGALACLGMNVSEIINTNDTDHCRPLEMKHLKEDEEEEEEKVEKEEKEERDEKIKKKKT